jgi:hypothetical protein
MANEKNIRKLVAYDNLDLPLCAVHNRMDRKHKKLAASLQDPIDAGDDFGEAIVNIRYDNKQKSRAISEAVDEFVNKYPTEGRELQKMIAVKRTMRETYLEYGMPEGKRISSQEYIEAMTDVGLTEAQAKSFYPQALELSRTLQRLRGKKTTSSGLREVLIGKSEM